MAIKVSNQITITEQKKILSIEEWYLATSYNSGLTTEDGDWGIWTKNVQTINANKSYLWNYEKVIYSLGDPEISDPIIIGIYSKSDGRGIDTIINEYYLTETPELPEQPEWSRDTSTASGLTPTLKYLWNREIIVYTDGSEQETDPAIIGVYGDSGSDAVDFQIYSVDGFEFSENITSITLNTVAFCSGESIMSDVTYCWKYWDSNESEYVAIQDATLSYLEVNNTSAYAFSSIKCEMTYNGITYEDYVTLTKKSILHTSVIKFFDGSNIFDQSKQYLVAYIELYKDGYIEDTVKASEYYDGNNTINSDGIITTDIPGEFSDDHYMYFIYKDLNNKYDIILGKYNSGSWIKVDNSSEYTYSNNMYGEQNSNILVISKQDISRSKEIYIEIYKNGSLVSRSSFTAIDTNDPIISDIEPANAKYGQLWLDTSTDPYVLKIYTKNEKIDIEIKDSATQTLYSSVSKILKKTYYYSDKNNLTIQEDGTIYMNQSDKNKVQISYEDYSQTSILKGKYFQESGGSTVFYMPEDAVISTGSSSLSGTTLTTYNITSSSLQIAYVGTNTTGEWKYFSQQNGGAVYISIPLNGYSKGDLWIISDDDVRVYEDEYPDLFSKFGSGTMLKTDTTSDSFIDYHWSDTMENVTATIKNIKETFSWGDDGLKIMRKVTDENGNSTNPFYVHIDSTRMGFHSVTYDADGASDDAEVVHIGINSAVIKNANFVDNDSDPDEYEKYNDTNGAVFDCNVEFNKEVSMNNILSDGRSVGFVFKIESNGSLSLCVQ